MTSQSQSLNYVTVDVFTEKRYRGNQLAIVSIPKDRKLSQEEKQTIAIEFNYSETVFLYLDSAEPNKWNIDIFTTEQELGFAGHPTVGTACYLGYLYPNLSEATIVTKAGPIPFFLKKTSGSSPAVLPEATASIPQTLHIHQQRMKRDDFLVMQPKLINQNKLSESFPVGSITNGMNFALYGLDSMETLRSAWPPVTVSERDFVTLDQGWNPAQFSSYLYCIDHSSSSAEKLVVHTRMMDKALEDAATGSAACCLSGYLTLEQKKKGFVKDQTLEFEIVQGEQMGRESHIGVRVKLDANDNVESILLKGKTVLVMSGHLIE